MPVKSQIKIISFLFSILVLFPVFSLAAVNSADEIVSKADEVRSPQLDYTVDVKVTSINPEGTQRSSAYEVLVKGKEKTIIKTLSPEADRGRTLLMLGKDLWAFLPDVSKPIRISLQQRLLGEVANGDIARANFSGDYTAKLLRTEKIDGQEYHVLELTAISDEVTYNKVVYWVRKDNLNPFKAEFHAVSGRLLKTCSYEDYRVLAGKKRPSRLVLTDPLVKGRMSIIRYENMKAQDLPDKFFTKDHMKKLKY